MSGLLIDAEACVGCGRCVRACASGGIAVEGERPNRCAHVTDSCILCGSCVDACPVGALSIERDKTQTDIDLSSYRDIWVFAQTDSREPYCQWRSSCWDAHANLPPSANAV